MKKIAWMLFFALVATSCTGSKSSKGMSESAPQIELSDSDEFTDLDPLATTEPTTDADNDLFALDESAPVNAPVIEDMQDASVSMGEGMGEYKVEKNETLMMIAFKIYGDYSKWKMLADQNQGILKNGVVMAGSKISYQMPSQTFNWSPEGNPYLIKSGDTLGTISSDVYGTTKKWKLLWDNNKPLIKDPNRIFAGFTIYWTEQGKVASSENQFEL